MLRCLYLVPSYAVASCCDADQLAEYSTVELCDYFREEEQTVKDLQTEFTTLSADRDTLDQNIQDLTTEIADLEEDVPHADSACSAFWTENRYLSFAMFGNYLSVQFVIWFVSHLR